MDAWEKGEFGKPFGSRPKINALRTLCAGYLPQAWELLLDLVNNKMTNETVKLQGLKFIFEQACGKAPQTVEVKVMDGISPNMMSMEQLRLVAAGKAKELVFSLIQSGQIDEYIKEHKDSLEAGNMDIAKASSKDIKQLEQK